MTHLQNFAAPRVEISTFTTFSPRLQNAALSLKQPHPSPSLSVPSSFNQTFPDNLARFENIVPPWSAGRSQRPLSAKSVGRSLSPSASRDAVSNLDVDFAHFRSVAAAPLDIPLWKFEQQGISAITDTAFRMNHGKVLKSPRSRRMLSVPSAEDCGFMPLPVESSNTQGEPLPSHPNFVFHIFPSCHCVSGASLTGPVADSSVRRIDIHKSKVQRTSRCLFSRLNRLSHLSRLRQSVSPDGRIVHVYRVGEPEAAAKGSPVSAASHEGQSSANNIISGSSHRSSGSPRRATPGAATSRLVRVELPSMFSLTLRKVFLRLQLSSNPLSDGIGVNPSGRAAATALQVMAQPSGQSATISYFGSPTGPDPASLNAISSAASATLKSSSRISNLARGQQASSTQWRQKFRLATDSMQLSADSFPGKGFSPNKGRPSTAPRGSSHEVGPQPPSLPREAATDALVKGRSLKVSLPHGSADTNIAFVAAPPLV